ncbi:MAG: hybrid sensor histidine kinase/response regulator [Candidatus Thiothrix singaporensis]|uniref:histidine kinase n=1 Tax=Candidatus Thiothrix singaporensis TaxID=2799669 RepID=A0A7L6AUB5_9GAMM|nr:MAG: hybrid sensor histidine kinase/response regulator [Candidatus Thiothrix singaporensis]
MDDLLDVSRVTRGKIKLQKERVNLAEIIRQAIETSRPLIDARNHQLKVCLPQAEICVDGDATRLAQIISNLLNNAAKYTDAGGYISLMLEQRSGSIGGKALIRVKDNGRGWSQPRWRTCSTCSIRYRNIDRAEGGLGIGLYLVKTLAAMHGGHVEAFSEGRGKGSEFVIHLPCLRPEQSGEGLAADAEAKPVCGKRILLVDDNPDVADSMAMLLKLFGHEIIIAYDGREAVSIALREQPDVVLLDIGLPYLNGYEACRAMRKAGLTRAMIVALTGYGQEEDRKKRRKRVSTSIWPSRWTWMCWRNC